VDLEMQDVGIVIKIKIDKQGREALEKLNLSGVNIDDTIELSELVNSLLSRVANIESTLSHLYGKSSFPK
jgi:hypothetical protein